MRSSDDLDLHSNASEESDENEQHQDGSFRNAKKVRSSRACIACRRMKTRCEIDEALGTACKLCIRARRQCIMQSIPRRRKRKTTERVADLEQKINTLTALLATNDPSAANNTTPDSAGAASSIAIKAAGFDPSPAASIDDAMQLGFLDWNRACKAFDWYRENMSHYLPFVVFPATADANVVKEQQPLLFFAIVTVALTAMPVHVNAELCDMLTKELALRIVYRGERSLELVQTLLVHCTWYARAKNMRELNFNQLAHIACTMALDIGLGRRSHKGSSTQPADPHQLESLTGRRAWLGCYYMGTSLSMSLRHPSFVRWSVYIDECLDVLSSEPHALPSDKWLCDLIRIQRIGEDASVVFSMDDPGCIISFRDVKTQYQLGGFRSQLEHWRRSAQTNLQLPYVRQIEAFATLYLHEIALHSDHNIDELRSPLRASGPGSATQGNPGSSGDSHFVPARVEALFACLAGIHAVFDAMLSMDVATVCTLPNFFFVRTGYAARALRKLLSICESQVAATGQPHIDMNDLKFDEYMNSLIELFAKVYAQNNSHVVRAFCCVLTQIKTQGLKSLRGYCFRDGLHGGPDSLEPDNDPPSAPGLLTARLSGSTEYLSRTRAQLGLPDSHALDESASGLPASLPVVQPSSFDAQTNDPAIQSDLSLWLQVDSSESAMSGTDMLQWFEQDFAFDDLDMLGLDGINTQGMV